MATKNTVPTNGAKKPKPAPKAPPEPRSRISDLDVDERRAFEEWKRDQEQNQGAWEHPTNEELELKFLEKLNKKSEQRAKGAKSSKKDTSFGCPDDDPCGDRKPQIDLELLAEKVFQQLILRRGSNVNGSVGPADLSGQPVPITRWR